LKFNSAIIQHPLCKSFIHQINLITSETKAIYQINDYFFDLDSIPNKVIICNKQTHQMVTANVIEEIVHGVTISRLEEVVFDNIEFDQIIDLNENGRRWEGCSKDGLPYGYGREYDEDNNLEFEGFVYEYDYVNCNPKYRVGYGVEYYADINLIEYEGIYFRNSRFYGISYDRNGAIDLEGYQPLHTDNNKGNDKYQKTAIHWISCRYQTIDVPNDHFCDTDITQCRLCSINSVISINIDYCCFSYAKNILFSDLPNVKTITIGSDTFKNCTKITFKSTISFSFSCFKFQVSYINYNLDLPSLETMTFQKGSCSGDSDNFKTTYKIMHHCYRNILYFEGLFNSYHFKM